MTNPLHQAAITLERMVRASHADSLEITGWKIYQGNHCAAGFFEAEEFIVGWDSQCLLRLSDPEVALFVCLSLARKLNLGLTVNLGHGAMTTTTNLALLTAESPVLRCAFEPEEIQRWFDVVRRVSSAHGALEISARLTEQ